MKKQKLTNAENLSAALKRKGINHTVSRNRKEFIQNGRDGLIPESRYTEEELKEVQSNG